MSSRFVSGGITDTKTGDIAPAHPAPSDTTNTSSSISSSSSKKSEEWAAVQAQLEEERRRRQQQREAAQTGTAGEEKSLYEVLQANKAAKQAAFEEANKIKNQFRPLDDDEVEFLDGVRERKRLEEERLRRETEEGLRGFRELQQKVSASGEGPEDEGAAADAGDVGGWNVGRKRKRRKDESEGVLKGLKRRSSSAADGGEGAKVEEKGRDAAADAAAGQVGSAAAPKGAQDTQAPLAKPATPAAAKPKAGLVDYGSDDDSD